MTVFDSQITFVRTEDLERATRFYTETLELELVLDQGGCRIFRVSSGGYIGLCTHIEPAAPDSVILTLVTDDVDGWHEKLVARNVEIEKPPTLNEKWNIYHLFIRDPDDHLVEIQRFESEFPG